MTERKTDAFPESWLKWTTLIVVVGVVFYAFPPSTEDPYQIWFNRVVSDALILLGLVALVVTGFLGSLIWARRLEMKKEIQKLVGPMPTPDTSELSRKPAYLLADSLGRELLVVFGQVGGDLLTSYNVLKAEVRIKDRDQYLSEVSKLLILGLVYEPTGFPYFRVYLTPRGLDAVNLPPSLFVSNIQDNVWQHILRGKLAFNHGRWSEAAVAMASALAADMGGIIELEKNLKREEWEEVLAENADLTQAEASSKWHLGIQAKALRLLGFIKTNSFEDKLVSDFISLRNRVHPNTSDMGQTFGSKEASRMDLCLDLIMHFWHGPQ